MLSRPHLRLSLKGEMMKPTRLGLILLPALASLSPPAWSADLDLRIDNVKEAVGDLMVGIYSNAEDYRKAAVKTIKTPASGNPVAIRIPGLGAGDYAVAIYHDRNGNHKLDSNLLGIPKEPYGFSGTGRNLAGPATWEQAKFNLPAEGGAVTILLSD
jgi:uncharacterized protein (DUF2141 family)